MNEWTAVYQRLPSKPRKSVMKNLLVISTGGTIASAMGENGLTPTFDVNQLLEFIPASVKALCSISGKHIMNIDSTNMNPELMKKIAQAIHEEYDAYECFLITHGTDTMAYTAAALTYMLQNIKKPVVITGSQLSIGAAYTDAKMNVVDAITFALEGRPGVYIAFDGHIINGTRAKKVRTRSMNAFESINYPYVAQVKLGRVIYSREMQGHIPVDASKPYQYRPDLCTDVSLLKIFPGMDPTVFDFIKERYRGVILESFGIGGIPNEGNDIVAKIRELIDAGIAVVITTQCQEEGVDLGIYEVGTTLAKSNIILAGDMTSEAVLAKLWWALGNLGSLTDVKYFMETPVFDDISTDTQRGHI